MSIFSPYLRAGGAADMLHFIYNPISGKGKAKRCRAALEALLQGANVEHRFHETQGPGDGTGVARRLTEAGARDIVALGGDGTLNEVLNGLSEPAATRLGIIPCGSGNDFADMAGIPDDPEAALALILHGQARLTDYLECSGVRGINAIGTGIDVEILRRYNRMKLLKGSAAYLTSLLSTLLTYRAKQFTEVTDASKRRHNALIACVGNGQRIGGGICVCPEAAIDDGLLDIVIVDDIPRRRIPGAFVKLMKRQILAVPGTCFYRAGRLRLESDEPLPVQIDGEIHEGLPFDVRVLHGVLRVYRP